MTLEKRRKIALDYFDPTGATLEGIQIRGLASTGLRPLYPSDAVCPAADSFFGDRTRGDGSTRSSRFFHGFHGGLDTPVPEGTPILAVADGIVVSKGAGVAGGIGGINIFLQHTPENTGFSVWLYTEYKHLKELPSLELGERVKMGRQIGISGKTGTIGGHYGSEGHAHLHFTAFMSPDALYSTIPFLFPPNGLWIDPLAIYLEEPLDTPSVGSLPASAKSVAFGYITNEGVLSSAESRIVWPMACESR